MCQHNLNLYFENVFTPLEHRSYSFIFKVQPVISGLSAGSCVALDADGST